MAGYVKRTKPLTDTSTGPLKTSPSGMFAFPEAFRNVRPWMDRRRSTSGPRRITWSCPSKRATIFL